jgi:streptogramin lyase
MPASIFSKRVIGIAALAIGGSAVGAAHAQTKVWTTNADFDSGSSNAVRHTPVPDQLILDRTPVSKTRLVWVSNTAPGGGGATPLSPGWIVRIDTTIGPNLGKQTARFDSVLLNINGQPTGVKPSGNNPGRVAVDTNGDVWIANRAYYEGPYQGSLSKFSGNLAHCIDRNANGVIDTSIDANGDGIIDPYKTPALGTPGAQVEYFGQADECILTTIKVGVPGDIPRAVAVDREGKIWVGTHTGHSLYRYNPNDPVALEASRLFTPAGSPSFPITAWFYSAATADDYIYLTSNAGWSAASGTGQIVRVNIHNINQADYVVCGGGAGTCGSVYGIVAIPGTHKAWAGGYSGTGIYKVDFDAIPPTCTCVGVPSTVTAVTLDLNGKIWASGYGSGNVFRINPVTNAIEATCPTGGTSPHGLSVDFDGYIWSVQDGPYHLVRFDPVATANNCGRTNYPIDRGNLPVPGGQSVYNYTPYLYSDFTGVQIDRQAPYTRLGSWEGTFDGGVPGVPWSKAKWNSEAQGSVPAGTTLVVSARAADTLAALGQAAYAPVTNGGVMSGIKGRYVELRADLKGPGYLTSVLSDVSVTGPCDPLSQACCVKDADCDDGDPCTADACPVPGGACTHSSIPQCCMTDKDCDDQNLCTTDACPSPGGQCQHAAQASCCMSSADCNDGDVCTADVCPNPGGQCSFVPINGCCTQDADCTKGDKCSAATCVGGFCQDAKKPNCCLTDADCADKDLCTLDTCDVANGTCNHAVQQGCCNVDGQCDDQNACTHDQCSGPGGVCVHSAIAGCCTPQDPQNGQPCDLPVSPNDHPPCKPGQLVCENGAFVCKGAVKPAIETCNNVDDDCDGLVDDNACPEGLVCTEGVCAKPCQGETPCPGGFQCYKGYCVPTDCAKVTCAAGEVCKDGICYATDGGAGGGVPTGTGGAAGGSGGGTTTGAGGAGGSTATTTTGAGGAAPTGAGGAAQAKDVWGLATGGACKCAVPGAGGAGTERAGLVLAGLAVALSALRRRARRR